MRSAATMTVPTDLPPRFRQHLHEAALFPDPGRALLAVSGGLDSVVMLDLMVEAAPAVGLTLIVGHVDHGIRPDSERVADQVREVAARYGLACHSRRLDLGPSASETEARRERYRALRALQREVDARYLVTAHQADDQIETVLFRFIRGSGVAGLAGVAAQGAMGLVRPLLPFHRGELSQWAEHRGLSADSDPANRDPRHDRSWLRSVLLPELRERFGPEVDSHILGVAADAGRNRTAWSQWLAAETDLVRRSEPGLVEVARDPLARYHKVLSQTLLRACALEVGCRIGPGQAVRLHEFASTGRSGTRLDLGRGWRAELDFGRLRLVRRTAGARPPDPCRIEGDHGETRFGAWSLKWRLSPAGTIQRRGNVTWFPPGSLVVRPRQPGDRLVPLGGTGSRKLRRVLMEGHVPLAERGSYPVVERDGVVVWVPGLCRAAAAIPDAGQTALELEAGEGTRSPTADTTHAG